MVVAGGGSGEQAPSQKENLPPLNGKLHACEPGPPLSVWNQKSVLESIPAASSAAETFAMPQSTSSSIAFATLRASVAVCGKRSTVPSGACMGT